MTFREALQREINIQGLSVAQVAKTSKVSKGAIYNILNGTTEDERIRPATRKALARACDREVLPDGDGVTFVDPGKAAAASPIAETRADTPASQAVVVSWVPGRPFRPEHHLGAAFDWLHGLEQQSRLEGLRLVDRVYQKRPDFLALVLHNRGSEGVTRADIVMAVDYPSLGEQETFRLSVVDPVQPGHSIEHTVFVCAGATYTARVESARITTADGQTSTPVLPESFTFGGGHVD